MANHIFIIHPSEIIRNGMREACRGFNDMDIFVLQDGDETFNTLAQKQNIRILMIDATSPLTDEILSQTDITHSFKTIGIYYPVDWPHRIGAFDVEINTNMTIDKIQECLRDLLDNQKGTGEIGIIGHQLTVREQEVLKLLALGHSHKEIGRILNISVHTVISHRKNITQKLGIKSVSGLAVYAIISGFIDTDKINPESLI
jgi:DNA-binding NarL/FixJ family response regulator